MLTNYCIPLVVLNTTFHFFPLVLQLSSSLSNSIPHHATPGSHWFKQTTACPPISSPCCHFFDKYITTPRLLFFSAHQFLSLLRCLLSTSNLLQTNVTCPPIWVMLVIGKDFISITFLLICLSFALSPFFVIQFVSLVFRVSNFQFSNLDFHWVW